MTKTNVAFLTAAALLTIGSSANADFVLNFPGAYTYTQGGAHAVTLNDVTGTLTGIRVTFTYEKDGGSSAPQDVAFTVGVHQWGGYYPMINGAEIGECPTGAPGYGDVLTHTSVNLGMGYGDVFSHEDVLVGFGNGNTGGACTISNLTVTLLGVVPTPGAAAALSLSGLTLMRRKRRA